MWLFVALCHVRENDVGLGFQLLLHLQSIEVGLTAEFSLNGFVEFIEFSDKTSGSNKTPPVLQIRVFPHNLYIDHNSRTIDYVWFVKFNELAKFHFKERFRHEM